MDSERENDLEVVLGGRLCGSDPRCDKCSASLKNFSSLADRVGYERVSCLASFIRKIRDSDINIARYFVEKSIQLAEEIGYNCLEKIVEKSLELFKVNKERAISFAKGESEEYVDFVEEFSDSVRLKKIKPVLAYYVNALLGYRVEIDETKQAVFTDGEKIYLPAIMNEFNDKERNFIFYKVLATHEEAHLQYGSFDFNINKVKDVVDKLKSRFGGGNGGK